MNFSQIRPKTKLYLQKIQKFWALVAPLPDPRNSLPLLQNFGYAPDNHVTCKPSIFSAHSARVMENCQKSCARVEQPILKANLKMCDQIFNLITFSVADCDYIDFYDNSSNLWNCNDSLILVHLNIRSLHKNFDKFHEFVSLLPFKPDVMRLSEARINQPLKNIQVLDKGIIFSMQNLVKKRAV